MKSPKDFLIVALDTSSFEEALKLVDTLEDKVDFYKVGLELFSATGIEVVKELKKRNKKIFFDGKFHDIPNTVNGAVRNIAKLGVEILNVHTLGGKKMMSEAKKEVSKINPETKLIGVTILTSTSEEEMKNDLKINENIEEHILFRAKLAKESGLDGVVASPKEAKLIRENLGEDFLIITPGVRPSWASKDDQSRITTPKDAVLNGVSHIVIGRPITKADNPKEAATKVLNEIEEVFVK